VASAVHSTGIAEAWGPYATAVGHQVDTPSASWVDLQGLQVALGEASLEDPAVALEDPLTALVSRRMDSTPLLCPHIHL
jgi:hypothetical protein